MANTLELNEPFAIISDIHANYGALTAVLRDIEKRGIERIINLGDTIGRGYSPKRCLNQAIEFDANLRGNHDEGVLSQEYAEKAHIVYQFFDDEIEKGTISKVKESWDATRKHLANSSKKEKYLSFLDNLETELTILYDSDNQFTFQLYHASPNLPTQGYIFHDAKAMKILAKHSHKTGHNINLVEALEDMRKKQFARIQHCFVGHTHVPGLLLEGKMFMLPDEIGYQYEISPQEKFIINPGSVGDSRLEKGIPTYITVEGNTVYFHSCSLSSRK